MKKEKGLLTLLAASSLLLIFILLVIYPPSEKSNTVTVYCAHDSIYADKILKEFQKESGIDIIVKFDTEATKSIGLIELLKRERNNPRCDLFWNNEILGTMELKKEGILQPYKGVGYRRIPEKFKDPDGYWTGFAARLRVYIFNTNKIKLSGEKEPPSPLPGKSERPIFLPAQLQNEITNRPANFAIAKPLYGTTLTHFTCIAKEIGMDNLKKWYSNIKKQRVKILNGNAAVKDAVSIGGCTLGWTDTDDFFAAKFAGKPVEMRPVRLKSGATVSIPNSVAIIAGTQHLNQAEQLADFLLSAKCEIMLAESNSRQIPLGKVDQSKLPPEVRKLKEWNKSALTLTKELLPLRKKCIEWLKSELKK